jgi:hypothetical protein
MRRLAWVLVMLVAGFAAAQGSRQKLILKDGSYQWVLGYVVKGGVVHYRSAERNGAEEAVPLKLVDMAATEAWAAQAVAGGDPQRTVLSPELAREEAARSARTPEIAAGLRLPGEDSVVVLDQYKGGPELVPMEQQGGDLNKETAHDVRKVALNPAAAAHDILDLGGSEADVRVHATMPVFYVRVGEDDPGDPGGAAITVDTQGRAGRTETAGGNNRSDYVLVRLRAHNDMREMDSFRVAWLGERAQADVVELHADPMPGGKWVKLTPERALEEGEYALVEVLSSGDVNLLVWDFGVHPEAAESMEAIRPEAGKPIGLERR